MQIDVNIDEKEIHRVPFKQASTVEVTMTPESMNTYTWLNLQA